MITHDIPQNVINLRVDVVRDDNLLLLGEQRESIVRDIIDVFLNKYSPNKDIIEMFPGYNGSIRGRWRVIRYQFGKHYH